MTFDSCLKKQEDLCAELNRCSTEEAKYQKIIELGRSQQKMDPQFKVPQNQVKGCQSIMYLHSFFLNGMMGFEAESDALISAGLAALLIKVYSGEEPETILKCAPIFIDKLGITASLTPNRANGLYSIHLKMKQEALRFLIEKSHENPR